MLDSRFSREVQLANALRRYLIEQNAQILQLVSPGGQATISLTYKDAIGKSKTVFPDLLAIHNNELLIGEIKPKYSEADELKLIAIKNSVGGFDQVRKLFSRRINENLTNFQIKLLLIHAQSDAPARQIDQLILGSEIYLIPSCRFE